MSQAKLIPLIPQDYNGQEPISYNHNLLEYAQDVANLFWLDYDPYNDTSSPSSDPSRFYNRYKNGTIDTSRESLYLESEEVLQTLKAFGIDISKFWYLCLFIKDHIDGETINTRTINKTPSDELYEIIECLGRMMFTEGLTISAERGAELTLKLEGDNQTLSISNKRTMFFIKKAIEEYIPKAMEKYEYQLFSADIDFDKPLFLTTIHRIYLFKKYLTPFLKDKKAIKGIAASKDKNLLISRMIYILGISDSKNFYEERFTQGNNKIDYLKDYLKKYKPPHQDVINNHYFH